MPDISMCNNSDCKVKDKCYRYMAKPDYWQAYSNFFYEKDDCFIDYDRKNVVQIIKSVDIA